MMEGWGGLMKLRRLRAVNGLGEEGEKPTEKGRGLGLEKGRDVGGWASAYCSGVTL